MIVILIFSLLILTGCIFEAPCAFCNVEFHGTIDNMDSTKNLQMKLQAPNSDETIFEFEKISDLSSAKDMSDYIHQEKNRFICEFRFLGFIFELLLPIFSLEHPVHILMSLALSNGLLMEKPLKKFNYKNEPTKE